MDDDDLEQLHRPIPAHRPQRRHRRLARHPTARKRRGPCQICGALGHAYAHPNPLRTGVVLYRCTHHSGPRFAQDDPKGAPGGGRYR